MLSKIFQIKNSRNPTYLVGLFLVSHSKYFCPILTTMTAGYWLFLLTITNEILVICPNFKHVNW